MDLHAPLGRERKQGGAKRRFRAAPMATFTAAILLLGFSTYTAWQPLPLSETPPVTLADDRTASGTSEIAGGEAIFDDSRTLQTARPQSGANVERMVTDDGNVVTTFKPNSRDGNGPLLIDTRAIGQDPRLAARPNEDLLEETPEGLLPVVAADGLRPVDHYARPWSGARGARIAIVVGGIGLSQTGSQRAIRELPEDITLAFAATGNSLTRWMQEARQKGHEILLQVPMEPFDYPTNNPGRGTLLTSEADADNLANLHQAMARMTNYTGIMNYMGGKFLANEKAMDPVMRDIADRGLLFLDDGSTARSLTGGYGKALGMPHAFGDVLLDGQLNREAILNKLDELERIARRNGQAIGIASAFDESIDAIAEWRDEAIARGIEIVGVSAIATENER